MALGTIDDLYQWISSFALLEDTLLATVRDPKLIHFRIYARNTMKTRSLSLFLALIFGIVPVAAWGQTNVVSRTTKAVNYRRAGESTKIDFRATALNQRASGEARVENKRTRVESDPHFYRLLDSPPFGHETLTYV